MPKCRFAPTQRSNATTNVNARRVGVWFENGAPFQPLETHTLCQQLLRLSPGELGGGRWARCILQLLRSRYRSAAQYIHAEGKPSCLVINDIDAGVGRQKNTTGYTVNTQLVQATVSGVDAHAPARSSPMRWLSADLLLSSQLAGGGICDLRTGC